MPSPYEGVDVVGWPDKTRQLIDEHPLKMPEIVEVVLGSWQAIFDTRIGPKGYRIGIDISPKPQIMGFLLHELIPVELAQRYPGVWCPERTAADKDIVCLTDDRYSIELKTSSHPSQIFGNRSYAQKGGRSKKSKSGYYLAVNFESFKTGKAPEIVSVRFGWLDDDDWVGQKSTTGQQARLSTAVERGKLVDCHRRGR